MKKYGKIFAWTLFDFANTSFSVIIVTVIYAKYFSNYVAHGGRSIWGLAVSISMILAAILSPPLGAISDYSRNRKRFLMLFTLLCIVSTLLMYFVKEGDILLGFALFVLANLGFEAGLVFYDSFLPNITDKKNFGRVSGYGFAMGYLGALVILVISLFIIPDTKNINYYFYIRLTFVISAFFFLIFSLPLFIFVSENTTKHVYENKYELIKIGIKRSITTFKEIFVQNKYPSLKKFLISFFLYNDAIITIIAFSSIYASDVLKMSDAEIIYFFAIVQSTAILGAFCFGIISDHIGPKKTIIITLFIWIIVAVGSFFITSIAEFYALGFTAGIAIGSSQSCSRSLMALVVPKGREAEFFGFYDGLFGKSSAILGPLIFGIISDLLNPRYASLSLSIFFISGLILLTKVKVTNEYR